MVAKKPLGFKDFLSVDYTQGSDDQIARNAKKRKQDTPTGNTGESTTTTDEALDFQQRRARSRQMKKIKAKIAMGRKRFAKRAADPKRLEGRARKAARNILFKKFSKGKSRSEIPMQQRQTIEKRLEKMKGRIGNIAKKILPQIRKLDKERRSSSSSPDKKEGGDNK
jgi:hypothetical protein